jgi:PDZ domain-containing secreted protein
MSKRPVRFTSQWVLVGVIFFYTIGSTMIARHTKRIFKPASAGGSEHIKYSYSNNSKGLNQPETLSGAEQRQNGIAGLTYWDVDESNLMLYDVAFSNELQFYRDRANTTEQQDTEQEDKKEVQQELTKIQTELKCVETLLKKAVIETYCVDDQTKGLQLSGLDEMSEAKELQINNGDVILAVNGNSLCSKKEAYEIFLKARKEPIMIIDLLQDGKPKKLLLDFQ